MKEIKAVADRCTVIRRGKTIGTVEVADTSREAMAEMMVGRSVSFKVDKQESRPGKTVLEIKSLTVKNSKKVDALKGFSLDLHAGEIVGIAGVDGNGQSELIEAITGLREAESGTVSLNGKTLNGLSVRQRNESGIGHIPEDRQKRDSCWTIPLKRI